MDIACVIHLKKMKKILPELKYKFLIQIVCDKLNISIDDYFSNTRLENVVTARVIIANILTRVLEFIPINVTPYINRDHSTVSYYYISHNARMRTKQYSMLYEECVNEISNALGIKKKLYEKSVKEIQDIDEIKKDIKKRFKTILFLNKGKILNINLIENIINKLN